MLALAFKAPMNAALSNFFRRRSVAAFSLLASLALCAVRSPAATSPSSSSSTPAVLTTANQVRALTEEEARGAVPVRLRGVFMGEADPEGIAFVIQDETEGI